jgi:hypothetical protein
VASYLYKVIPTGSIFEIGGQAVEEQTLVSEDELTVGDVVPLAPGIWVVERVGAAGTTRWASEAVSRVDPQTLSPLTLYCRVEA